jgi:hypothetical protein
MAQWLHSGRLSFNLGFQVHISSPLRPEDRGETVTLVDASPKAVLFERRQRKNTFKGSAPKIIRNQKLNTVK